MHVATFEEWQPEGATFDAVTAFTAWHWFGAPARTAKAAAVLPTGRALVTVTTAHVAGGTQDFFDQAQACYERWDPAAPKGFRLPRPDDVPPARDEADSSPLFGPATRRRFQQEIRYTARQFVEVLSTYSVNRALDAERRTGLMRCIERLIDSRFDGAVTKRYLHELRVTRRV